MQLYAIMILIIPMTPSVKGVCTSSSNHLCMSNGETMIENDRVDVLIAQQNPYLPPLILIQAKLVGHISLNECRLMRMNQMNWDSNWRNLTERR